MHCFYRLLFVVAVLSALVTHAIAEEAQPDPLAKIKPVMIAGGYAVVVSKETNADPQWSLVVEGLKKKYSAQVIVYDKNVSEAKEALTKSLPRFACFVARPEEAGRQFVIQVHRLTRKLDDDPYTDLIWGIMTGYEAADALRMVQQNDPLVIHRAAAGTSIPLDVFDSGVWYSEEQKGLKVEKGSDGKIERQTGPDDSTQAVVETLNTYQPELFLTSGHATERDWQMGYSYRNGQFRCADGVLKGIDLNRKEFPIHSMNPKVYLPLGNCLMGHIRDRQSMAVAFMHSAGVNQMCGYVVSTWFGYGGWGIKDYYFAQPGRFTLAEAFYANQQALLHELETKYPQGARYDNEQWNIESDPRTIGRIAVALGYKSMDEKAKDHVGLIWDRDTVAFYGDPAWEARLAPHDLPWDQSLTEKDGVYTFKITARHDVTWGRPPLAFLPHRVRDVKIISGQEFAPTVSGLFVLMSAPNKLTKDQTCEVVFQASKVQ